MTINGDRIRQAREIAGITQEQLGASLGITQAHIAMFEQSFRNPKDSTIAGIAMATGFPVNFFQRETAPDFALGSMLYRKRKSMTGRDRDRVRQLGRLILDATLFLSHRFKSIDLKLPRIGGSDPERAARITRAELGFSPDIPITNLVNRLERNGVIIAPVPIEIEEHDAFSVWADTEPRTPVIVITSGKPGDRQRWSMSHELGHLVMHYTYNGLISEIEDEANRFASEFLLPEEAIRKDLHEPLTLTMLADLKSRWGVAMQAIIMRAFQLNVITDGQRRYLFRQMAVRDWLKNEPVAIQAEKPRLLRKMAEAVHGATFHPRCLAEPLGISEAMMSEIIDSYRSASEVHPSSPAQSVQKKGKLLTMRVRTGGGLNDSEGDRPALQGVL